MQQGKLALTALVLATTLTGIKGAHAEGAPAPTTEAVEAHEHQKHTQHLKPSEQYSGNTPIDLSHGNTIAHGTFGLPDPGYEALGKTPLVAPDVLAMAYPFEMREKLIMGIANRVNFFEHAIANLKERSTQTKPDAIAFSDEALPRLESLLAQLKKSARDLKGAGRGSWGNAEKEARTALLNLNSTYVSLTSTVAPSR